MLIEFPYLVEKQKNKALEVRGSRASIFASIP